MKFGLVLLFLLGSFTLYAQMPDVNMNVPPTQAYGPFGLHPGNDLMENLMLQMAPNANDNAATATARAALRRNLNWDSENGLQALQNFATQYASLQASLNASKGGSAGLPESEPGSLKAVTNYAAIIKAHDDFRNKVAALVFQTQKAGASQFKAPGTTYVDEMFTNLAIYPGDIVYSVSRNTSLSIVNGDLQIKTGSTLAWHTSTTTGAGLYMQADGESRPVRLFRVALVGNIYGLSR